MGLFIDEPPFDFAQNYCLGDAIKKKLAALSGVEVSFIIIDSQTISTILSIVLFRNRLSEFFKFSYIWMTIFFSNLNMILEIPSFRLCTYRDKVS